MLACMNAEVSVAMPEGMLSRASVSLGAIGGQELEDS